MKTVHSVHKSVGSSVTATPASPVAELSSDALRAFVARHAMKNRTIVSRDIPGILDDMERVVGLPLTRHRYATGEEHGTWLVPPRWDVRAAWLRDAHGTTIASYDTHPLFVAPYSMAVHRRVSREELLTHTVSSARQPDAFAYNWRYAMDARKRLRDWGISLPLQVVERLGAGPFEIHIATDVADGEMLVGQLELPGERSETLCFLADYCHPGQVNDSFSGLALFMRIMHALAQRPHRRYTYRFLCMPETIGAAVYLAADPAHRAQVFGSIFAENVAYGGAWYLKATRRATTYLDLLAAECRRVFPDLGTSPFVSLTGNDEYIFDSVSVGIPSLALLKYPFAEYHTSNDTLGRWCDADMDRASAIVMHCVDVLERDAVVASTTSVPWWMSRFELFADAIHERDAHLRNFQIVYHLLDGRRSMLQIAHALGRPFAEVHTYLQRAATHGLVRDVGGDALERLRLHALQEYTPIVSMAPVMDARPSSDAATSRT